MSSKNNFSKNILKKLGKKQAISIDSLKESENSDSYTALSRSIKNLIGTGLAEIHRGGQTDFLRLTKEGKKKVISLKLDNENTLVNTNWDGYWRIILLDLPESRKAERESLRYLLKKAGFVCLKNSAWISPFPYEYLFENIKKDLGLTTELVIITTNKIDSISEKLFFENFKK